MATLARTYRTYVNPDGSLNLTRATAAGKRIVTEALITTLAPGWTAANVGTAVAADLTTLPIASTNSDTDVGGV